MTPDNNEELLSLPFLRFLYSYFNHGNTLIANADHPLAVFVGQLKEVHKNGVPAGDVLLFVTSDAWCRLVISLAMADYADDLGK